MFWGFYQMACRCTWSRAGGRGQIGSSQTVRIGGRTYSAGGGLLLGALSIDLEGNTVGGGALDLKGGG